MNQIVSDVFLHYCYHIILSFWIVFFIIFQAPSFITTVSLVTEEFRSPEEGSNSLQRNERTGFKLEWSIHPFIKSKPFKIVL